MDSERILFSEGAYFMKGSPFGAYVNRMRKRPGLPDGEILLKDLAAVMGKEGISVPYLSDILNGKRYPPDPASLMRMADLLQLTGHEREKLFDLAARERPGTVSADLNEYLMDESLPALREAIRTAKRAKLGDDFWKQLAESMESLDEE